tara:strand:+ start:1972 stop:3090 length:1119 start_codon:yes stop_codon:yes gene_type:complete
VDTSGNVVVSEQTAMQVPAVYRAIQLIAGDIARLPLRLYERNRDGTVSERTSGPTLDLLRDYPQPQLLDAYHWRMTLATRLILHGNAYVYVQRRHSGELAALPLLPVGDVQVVQTADGRTVYRSSLHGDLDPMQVVHARLPGTGPLDAFQGRGLLDAAKDTISLALQQQYLARSIYGRNAMPRIAFKHPGRLSDQAAGRLKESLNTALGSTDKSIVLEEGMGVEKLTMDLASVQYEQVNQQLVEDISRFTGVPMPLMAEHSESSYATVRELMRRYADACVVHYAEAITRELSSKICPSTRYLELDLTYLQRGPLDTEMAGLATGIQNSVLTPNEARRRFSLPPLPGGDALVKRLDTGVLEDKGEEDDGDFIE